MKIDVKLIKEYYNQIKKLNDNIEINYLNFYNEVNQALESWQDNNSLKFSEQINLEKNDYNKILLDLKTLESNLKIIYQKYETIGDQINYIKENKDSLYNLFDKYLDNINNSINFINNLDLSFCNEISSLILNVRNILIDNQNKIKNIKSKTKSIINNIEKKEIEISKLMANLDYKILKEEYYKDFV